MAWTERYVRADAAGSGDGTTNTNSGANGAWTLTEAVTNEAAGMRLHVMANTGTYASTTTIRTLAAAGTTTAPIWWYGRDGSDGDPTNTATAGTGMPLLSFTTGRVEVTGAHHILSGLAITSASVSASRGTLYLGAANNKAIGCRLTNSAANASGSALAIFTAGNMMVRCYLTSTTSAPVSTQNAGIVTYDGCYFDGGGNGITASGSSGLTVLNCVFNGQAGDAIAFSTGYGSLIGNSIYGLSSGGGNGFQWTGTPSSISLVANNYFERVTTAAKYCINNSSGTNTNLIVPVANGYNNVTAYTNGLGDSPLIYDVGSLGSAAFTNAAGGDFSIGTVAKALGFPGVFENISAFRGYLDLGAVQRQEPAGGGGVSGARIFTGM